MITLSQGSSGGQPDKQCAELRWLDVSPASMFNGTTLGVPWPQGMYRPRQSFVLHNDKGAEIPLQTWALAYWPDGSLKWTAHAIACGGEMTAAMRLSPGESEGPLPRIIISETADTIEVDTGTMKCRIGRAGKVVIRSIERNGRVLAQDGELVCLRQDRAEAPEDGNIRQERSIGFIEKAVVEQAGPLRAAVCLQGTHKSGGARAWLPFVLRLYFYWGGNTIRVMHTFIYDGDEHKDFVRGIGLRFAVPMHDQLHDRHIRFTGQDNGLWAEAVRGLTGLRRDPGQTTREAQVAGMPAPSVEEMDPRVANRLKLIPAWGDFTLSQLSADGFQIRKRTKPGHGWIAAGAGKRASGAGYVGGVSGGMAFGIRHFWQKHPSQLDIRGAASDKAEVTMWLWSPDA
ncbi:MAG TPA: hypothetical protein VLH60_03650, partial [Sedimentisphaerales bacterium]|nr:hypothetical protein [Sedimentisphaerales bacterium]